MNLYEKNVAEKLVLSFIHVDDRAMKKSSQTPWIDKQLAKRCAIICCDEIIAQYIDKDMYTPRYYKEVIKEIKEL